MANLIIYLGIFFLIIHIVMLIVCAVKPKKILWIIHLSSLAVTFTAILLLLTVFLQMMIDAGMLSTGDTIGLVILSAIGLIAYGIVFGLSVIIGVIRLLIWHEKKQLEPKIIS